MISQRGSKMDSLVGVHMVMKSSWTIAIHLVKDFVCKPHHTRPDKL